MSLTSYLLLNSTKCYTYYRKNLSFNLNLKIKTQNKKFTKLLNLNTEEEGLEPSKMVLETNALPIKLFFFLFKKKIIIKLDLKGFEPLF